MGEGFLPGILEAIASEYAEGLDGTMSITEVDFVGEGEEAEVVDVLPESFIKR